MAMKTLVKIVVVAVVGGAIGIGIGRMLAPTKDVPPTTPLGKLEWGNQHYAKGKPTAPRRDPSTRQQLATEGQKPFAIVVTCSDSRVPPEILFDQGLGDLFVVRSAGNVVDEVGLASIEYAVEHLGASLLIVVGHSECGAVKAVVHGGEAKGHLPALLRHLEPAVKAAKLRTPYLKDEVLVERVVQENVRQTLLSLWERSEAVRSSAEGGKLTFAGGVYDLFTGTIEWVEPPEPLRDYRAVSDFQTPIEATHQEQKPSKQADGTHAKSSAH